MIADPDVLPADLVDVMERRPGDGRAGDLRRPQVRDRRQGSGAPDIRDDVLEDGLDLLRRELVGDRPARRPADHPEPLLLVEPVDLDDHAVGLVGQVVALVAPGLREGDDGLDVEAGLVVRIDREAEGGQPIERGRLGNDARRTALLEELVGPRRQQPIRGDLRVLLAERARARVAGVRVEGKPCLLALRVDPGEFGLRHEDLAAGVERRGLLQAIRNRFDRPKVGCHVLAGRPVTAGRALDKPAALVAEGDREAVDLELRDVAEVRRVLRRRRQPEPAPDAGVERPQLVVTERVAERQHRAAVADLVECRADRPAHALGRRIRRDQLRMGGLQGDELPEQRVVLGVRKLRVVLLVIEPVGALDLCHQVGVPREGRVGVEGRELLDESRINGKPVAGVGDVGHAEDDTGETPGCHRGRDTSVGRCSRGDQDIFGPAAT